jgi:hypothetical protein
MFFQQDLNCKGILVSWNTILLTSAKWFAALKLPRGFTEVDAVLDCP